MTEMVRILLDHQPPRKIGTRAFGRPTAGVEVRVVDELDQYVAAGSPGEMVIRHSDAAPRRGFFSGYLKDEQATAQAWRGGWVHTRATVCQGKDGMVCFVVRQKNKIPRPVGK